MSSKNDGMVILVGMGERMAERFLPIYLMALDCGALGTVSFSVWGKKFTLVTLWEPLIPARFHTVSFSDPDRYKNGHGLPSPH